MNSLRAIWNELALKFTHSNEVIEELWEEIQKDYTKQKRHYHNLEHLEYMTKRAIQYKDHLTDFDTVLFSIFYHDIVYHTNRQDNEQKSADIAYDRLSRLGVPIDRITKCQNQIIATKDHQNMDDNDTKYFVDFDLAILGDTFENYKDYTEKIRKEYSIYPDALYKKGRKNVLLHFLDMGSIFKSDEFHDKFEQQARKNIKTELKEL